MLAFSGNALLTRAALASYNMDPELVLLLRVSAGAITLLLICYLRKYSLKIFSNLHLKTAAALSLYLVGFSYALTGLETGIGVLIQFGVVQLVMFASSFLSDKQVPKNKSIGAIIAFTGLIYLLWPSGDFTLDMKSSVLMAIAGMAWGIYSILGKNAESAISATTASFLISTPICLIFILLLPNNTGFSWSTTGALLAICSGAITSGIVMFLLFALSCINKKAFCDSILTSLFVTHIMSQYLRFTGNSEIEFMHFVTEEVISNASQQDGLLHVFEQEEPQSLKEDCSSH